MPKRKYEKREKLDVECPKCRGTLCFDRVCYDGITVTIDLICEQSDPHHTFRIIFDMD